MQDNDAYQLGEAMGHAGMDHVEDEATTDEGEMDIMGAVRLIGGAVIGISIVTLVVNEVLTVDSINNTSGPFSGVIDSLETTGVSAMVLLVVGLLAVAASRLMGIFGGGF